MRFLALVRIDGEGYVSALEEYSLCCLDPQGRVTSVTFLDCLFDSRASCCKAASQGRLQARHRQTWLGEHCSCASSD